MQERNGESNENVCFFNYLRAVRAGDRSTIKKVHKANQLILNLLRESAA